MSGGNSLLCSLERLFSLLQFLLTGFEAELCGSTIKYIPDKPGGKSGDFYIEVLAQLVLIFFFFKLLLFTWQVSVQIFLNSQLWGENEQDPFLCMLLSHASAQWTDN